MRSGKVESETITRGASIGARSFASVSRIKRICRRRRCRDRNSTSSVSKTGKIDIFKIDIFSAKVPHCPAQREQQNIRHGHA